MISLVCYFLLFPVVFAFNVSIYNGVDYYLKKSDTMTKNIMTSKCKDGDCFKLHSLILGSHFIYIGMLLKRGAALCASLIISEGRATSTSQRDLCVGPRYCVMVIDLLKTGCGKDPSIVEDTEKTIPDKVKPTNNTAIIIGSLSGVTLTLLAIISIKKRCWTKHIQQGTPDLPTNQDHQPFYVNMLFRRECEEEIAEIEQHYYEEINPHLTGS